MLLSTLHVNYYQYSIHKYLFIFIKAKTLSLDKLSTNMKHNKIKQGPGGDFLYLTLISEVSQRRRYEPSLTKPQVLQHSLK